jgi:hypothetical protein
MTRAFAVIMMGAALGALIASSATASDHRRNRGGFVMPCSLDGVNPVHHPDIFGDPAVARSYGFVRSPNGGWQVQKDCRRY